MHLTNYAINKLHPNFEFNESLEGIYGFNQIVTRVIKEH